jgi:hypothetical protein
MSFEFLVFSSVGNVPALGISPQLKTQKSFVLSEFFKPVRSFWISSQFANNFSDPDESR